MVPLANKSCNLAGCHGANMPSAGLRLTEDVVTQPAALVDRLNAGDPNGCAAAMFKLIDRAEPEKSLLYRKVTGSPPCGVKMPVGPALSTAETACILSWIKSAARCLNGRPVSRSWPGCSSLIVQDEQIVCRLAM